MSLEQKTRKADCIYYEFDPLFYWNKDNTSDTVFLVLPGFKKEQLRVQVTSPKVVTVSGEKQINEKQYRQICKDVSIPSDSDTRKISAKFEAGILYVKLPKLINQPNIAPTPTQQEPQKPHQQTTPQKPNTDHVPDQKKQHEPKKDIEEVTDQKKQHEPKKDIAEVTDQKKQHEPKKDIAEVTDQKKQHEPKKDIVEVTDQKKQHEPKKDIAEVTDQKKQHEPKKDIEEVTDQKTQHEPKKDIAEVTDQKKQHELKKDIEEVTDQKKQHEPKKDIAEVTRKNEKNKEEESRDDENKKPMNALCGLVDEDKKQKKLVNVLLFEFLVLMFVIYVKNVRLFMLVISI